MVYRLMISVRASVPGCLEPVNTILLMSGNDAVVRNDQDIDDQ